jgi:hypothetical protein
MLFVHRREVPHVSALRIFQSGLALECCICLHETVVDRMPIAVEDHLDDAEAVVD